MHNKQKRGWGCLRHINSFFHSFLHDSVQKPLGGTEQSRHQHGNGRSSGVCTGRVRAVAVAVQHGVSKPEREGEAPCRKRGAEVTGYWLHKGSRVYHYQKRELQTRKKEKARKNAMVLRWIRGTDMNSWSAT